MPREIDCPGCVIKYGRLLHRCRTCEGTGKITIYTKEEFINLKGWNSYLLKQNEELQEDIKRLQKALESIERCSTNKRIKDIDLKARGKNET